MVRTYIPRFIEKTAQMAYGICKNHPFTDGNKRSAILSMLTMLQMNEITLCYTQQELIALGLGIAAGTINDTGIIDWINQHIKEL